MTASGDMDTCSRRADGRIGRGLGKHFNLRNLLNQPTASAVKCTPGVRVVSTSVCEVGTCGMTRILRWVMLQPL